MIKMKATNLFKSIIAGGIGMGMLSGCLNLDEELYGRLSPETYYQTEEEALSSVVGVYQFLSYMSRAGGDGWRVSEFGTDEFFCPGRASGGWYDEANMQIMSHKITPDNAALERVWEQSIFKVIGGANAVLASMEASPLKDDLKALIAETRALRAYGYYYAMDYFGNVPLFTGAKVDANNLPKTESRKTIYDFVVKEFTEAAEDLPSIKEVNRASYYPRLTKEAVYTALASVYLNAEVYAGEAHWGDVVTMCNNVIGTNAYSLEDKVGDCFLATNEANSTEIISSFAVDPSKGVDGNEFILYAQHALDQKKYNLPFAPANGYCFTDEALNRYEAGDERLELLEYGPQYYQDGVTPLCDDKGNQLVLTTIKDMVSAQDNEGYRVLKYSPVGVAWSGSKADNDYILERYSNVLLMKAEALFRQNIELDEALELVNLVRRRSNLSDWDELTLKKIEEERAREFIWENQRRRDMIRFGSYFTDTWFYKTTVTEKWRGIYPIPAIQLNNNPNLVQNPNY